MTKRHDGLLPPGIGVGSEPPDGYESEAPPKPVVPMPEIPPHPLDQIYGDDDDERFHQQQPLVRDSEL